MQELPAFTKSMPPELAVLNSLSKNLSQAANPGYVPRDGPYMASASHEDFSWKQEEIDYISAHQECGQRYHRRQDDFVR